MSLTKNSSGTAALIWFKDLEGSNIITRHSYLRATYHGIGVYAGSTSSLYFSTAEVTMIMYAGEKKDWEG